MGPKIKRIFFTNKELQNFKLNETGVFKNFSLFFFFTKFLMPDFKADLCGSVAWDEPVKALLKCFLLQD